MASTLLVDSLLSVGKTYSMDMTDLRALCCKLVVLSLKYVDRALLWDTLFPDHFVDWGLLRPDTNILGDLHLWLPLLELFDWSGGLDRVQNDHPPLVSMRKCLRTHALDRGHWTMPCQLLILQMLQGIPVHQAFVMLTCRVLKRETHQSSALLLASLSDAKYTPEVYERLFAVLLGPCLTIDTKTLDAQVRAAMSRRVDLTASLKLKSVQTFTGRPRLRDRVTATEQQRVELDQRLGTWNTYTGFCQLHQFPNVLSETIKGRLYFMAAQHGWDWGAHVHRVLGAHSDLSARVAQFPVTAPELRLLDRCVDALSMDGSPPFLEMTEFRKRCFRSFPVTQAQRMTLTQVLQLYVCAYQTPEVWKDLWKMQFALLSPQIIKDCEAFVAEVPFATDAFMRLFAGAERPVVKAREETVVEVEAETAPEAVEAVYGAFQPPNGDEEGVCEQ